MVGHEITESRNHFPASNFPRTAVGFWRLRRTARCASGDVPARASAADARFSAAADRNVVTGMALSPAMDMLATTHGARGVYLWANSAMYAPARVQDRSMDGKTDGKTDGVVSDGNANGDDSDDDDVHAEGSSEEPTVLVRLPTLHAESADAETITLGSALNPVEAAKETKGLSAKQARGRLDARAYGSDGGGEGAGPAPGGARHGHHGAASEVAVDGPAPLGDHPRGGTSRSRR